MIHSNALLYPVQRTRKFLDDAFSCFLHFLAECDDNARAALREAEECKSVRLSGYMHDQIAPQAQIKMTYINFLNGIPYVKQKLSRHSQSRNGYELQGGYTRKKCFVSEDSGCPQDTDNSLADGLGIGD